MGFDSPNTAHRIILCALSIIHLNLLQPLTDVVMHVEKGYRMEAPEGCPAEIYAIMKEAWEMDPEKRPTFHEVLLKLNNLRAVTV